MYVYAVIKCSINYIQSKKHSMVNSIQNLDTTFHVQDMSTSLIINSIIAHGIGTRNTQS